MSKRIIDFTPDTVKTAVALLDNSALIAVPTETVYGLICKHNDKEAIEKIYKLKNRDENKPLSILVSNIEQAKKYAIFNDLAARLAQSFWPGPLTLVVPSKNDEHNWIGIRIPKNNFLNQIISMLEKPVVATSINFQGMESAVVYEDIPEFFLENIDAIFDIYDNLPSASSSTVLKIKNDNQYEILRFGEITVTKIEEYIN